MISVAQPALVGREAQYVQDCLTRGQLSAGGYVAMFERELSDACEVAYAAVCCNGTAALHLALLALRVKPGDEVLVPALTYVATANAVRYCGAIPVFVDVDTDTWTIDPEAAQRAVGPRTVGVIAVDLYGQPADIDALRVITNPIGAWIVEDAAEAIGAIYHDAPIGAAADITTLSFYGNKIITCGEGGAVLTPSKQLDAAMRLYRGQGVRSPGRYDHTVIGYNYRLGELQAAVGCAQIEQLWWHLTARRDLCDRYRVWAAKLGVRHQAGREGSQTADWMFTVLLPPRVNRDQAAAAMRAAGVETRPAFPLISEMPMYRDGGRYPLAADVAQRGLTLPTHAGVSTEDFTAITAAFETACCEKGAV